MKKLVVSLLVTITILAGFSLNAPAEQSTDTGTISLFRDPGNDGI
ncbi:hypothetical protein [Amphibacillus sediminis]|nr:hypothetical protein [Amphibacillus sediminis]